MSFCFSQNFALSDFDSGFFASSKEHKEKLYSAVKHVYIESIMNGDDKTKYEALQRLVTGAKELGYSYEAYEKEIKTSVKYDANTTILEQNIFQKTENISTNTIDNESEILPAGIIKVEQFSSQNYNTTTNSTTSAAKNSSNTNKNEENKNSDNKTAELIMALQTNANQTQENITQTNTTKTANVPAKLISAELLNGSVAFKFDNEIGNVKSFNLAGESIRYIYDIKAVKTTESLADLRSKNIKDIRVSQFDKETLRIVFESSKEINITYKIQSEDNELIFSAKEFQIDASSKNSTVSEANITPTRAATYKKVVVIDAGHGGKDSGAIGDKKLEKNAVLQIAVLLGNELKSREYTVHYTRSKDVYLKLQDRTKTANDKNADIFISIHANAAPKKSDTKNWQGIETFFLSPTDSKRSRNVAELENQSDIEEMNFYSKQTFLNFLNREKIVASHKLAIDIQQQILTSLRKQYKNIIDGGVREAPFWVLTGAQMPAILLEVGYITHKTDRERMFDKKFQQNLINGIADGIDSYFVKNI